MPRTQPAIATIPGSAPTSAADLARHLGGSKSGAHSWSCRCPAHDDANPSLSITETGDGKILVHCFAGCSQDAVIDALRSRGLWHSETITIPPELRRVVNRWRESADTVTLVNRLWAEGVDPAGTVAETYLAARRITLEPALRMIVLRFHPACVWESGTAPCLIAGFRAINGDDELTAIHRIRVDQPERWPKAERKMLGRVAGSAIKVDPAGECLVIGEGVETALAARQLGLRPVWALGSAGAIEKFPPVAGIDHLVILGENDSGTNRKAAEACRENWKSRHVTIIKPRRITMKDLNDLTMSNQHAQTATHPTIEHR